MGGAIVVKDWDERLILNKYVLMVLAFSLVSVAVLHNDISATGAICAFYIAVIAVVFYIAHAWKAGDAKLLLALSPLFMLLPSPVIVTMIFLVLVIIISAAIVLALRTEIVKRHTSFRSIPGGVAIMFSMVAVVSSVYGFH